MKRVRKRRFNKLLAQRLEVATQHISRDLNTHFDQLEYQQARRELNQRLRELANQLAARTSFDGWRTAQYNRSTWTIKELLRMKTHDDRTYYLTSHGHLVYDAGRTHEEARTLKREDYWAAWRKVRFGNPHVTNRQMMTLIRKLEQLLE